MKKLFKGLPVYKVSNFYKKETDKEFSNNYDYFIEQYKNGLNIKESGYFPKDNYSFPIENNDYTKKLMDKIFTFCKKKFKFSNSPYVSKTLNVYASNAYKSENILHNHYTQEHGKICSIYYFNAPEDTGGKIMFKLAFDDPKVFYYKPKKYDLLIFPDVILHFEEDMNESEEYKISLNYDISMSEDSFDIFIENFENNLLKRILRKFSFRK
jgi:hypothetical protein